ncbi:hypothetical protein SAMN05660642_03248 [Geodermatophilus siccatus]|uniref:Uncharacterized protein n=1 Tax=Geodermatophilus siccatus TaxID=1137991 RepID=A0A1G9VTE9_9ACTN|nr:hypothetical protein SAMN05660642_03248 [Geodermatophilus siccatus]
MELPRTWIGGHGAGAQSVPADPDGGEERTGARRPTSGHRRLGFPRTEGGRAPRWSLPSGGPEPPGLS